MIDADLLRTRIEDARERLAAAAPGRAPELLVAGKYVSPEEVPALSEAGITLIGENRLQDLVAKRALAPDLTYDFIGHLQRRKVRAVLAACRLVHAPDTRTHGPHVGKLLVRAISPHQHDRLLAVLCDEFQAVRLDRRQMGAAVDQGDVLAREREAVQQQTAMGQVAPPKKRPSQKTRPERRRRGKRRR